MSPYAWNMPVLWYERSIGMIRLPGPKLGPVRLEPHTCPEHTPEQHSALAAHVWAFCFRTHPLAGASGTSSVVRLPQADASRASTARCLAFTISSVVRARLRARAAHRRRSDPRGSVRGSE